MNFRHLSPKNASLTAASLTAATLTKAMLVFVLCLLPGMAVWAAETASDGEAAETDGVSELQDPSGFLYGVVETRNGSFEGILRWERGDMFWDDHLSSTKEDRPFLRHLPREALMKTSETTFLGRTLTRNRYREESRGFLARYRDIDRIEVHSRNWWTAVMRDGAEIDLSGGADLRRKLRVLHSDGEETRLDPMKILRIRFKPVPEDFSVNLRRMYGTLETTYGTFEGFILWDGEECVSTDTIDGDVAGDGPGAGEEMNIPFGDIQSIEKIDRRSSRLTLKDGRVVELKGSNDVDRRVRGIFVLDRDWSWLRFDWRAFQKLELQDYETSGEGYAATIGGRLSGAVHLEDGTVHRGLWVFDADEAYVWESLDGTRTVPGLPEAAEDSAATEGENAEEEVSEEKVDPRSTVGTMEFSIPMGRIATIERLSDEASRITHVNGNSVDLELSTDVSKGNEGLVIFGKGSEVLYVPWLQVSKLERGDSVGGDWVDGDGKDIDVESGDTEGSTSD